MTEPIVWKSLAAAIDGADASAEEASGAEREGWRVLAGWLRELWARRVAMGREPRDERNAAADMCCCDREGPEGWARAPQFRDGCPLHGEDSDHGV